MGRSGHLPAFDHRPSPDGNWPFLGGVLCWLGHGRGLQSWKGPILPPLPQVTAAQELQIEAQKRLASLMEEKLVTRISVLSTLLGGGKTTERLLVRISTETHKTSPDFDQTAANKAKNRIKQALGEIGYNVFIETDR